MELLGTIRYQRVKIGRMYQCEAQLHLAFFRGWKPQDSYYYLKLTSYDDPYIFNGRYLGERGSVFSGMFIKTVNEVYEVV